MRLGILPLGVLLVASPPVAATQQGDDNPLVRQLVAKMRPPAQLLQDSGFTLVEGVALLGSLRARTYEDGTMRLEAGREYVIVGVCDDDCDNIDLVASDRSGREIGADTQQDAMPVLMFVPEESGEYTFRVSMEACRVEPCAYFVQPFVRGGGGAAPARTRGLLGGNAPAGRPGGDRTERGRLESGDNQLSSGEYYDRYTFQGRRGQRVTLELRSSEFDTYLGLLDPSGNSAQQNDDAEQGNTTLSRIEHTLDADGEWTVVVTSYAANETGSYELRLGGVGGDAPAGQPMRGGLLGGGNPRGGASPAGQRVERGRLEEGDRTLQGGEYVDFYTFQGQAGQRVVIELTSNEFDTYVFVRGPGDLSEDNDDYQGSTERSRIEVTLPASGEVRVAVTSFAAGQTGAYVLTISGAGGGSGNKGNEEAAPGQQGDVRTERGTLAEGDRTLSGGEYYDTYTFTGRRGQRMVFDLRSSDFDTYVFVRGPQDFSEDNDDWEGSTSHSRIEATLPTDGEYRVVATSYRGGETGAYVLTIATGGGGATVAAASSSSRTDDGTRIERGSLAAGDQTLGSGEYVDAFTIEGRRGQEVVLDLQSREFDPYLLLRGPGDFSEDNDDFEGSRTRSVIRATLPADGSYTVGVTSYAAEETGTYELRITQGTGAGGQVASAENMRTRGALTTDDESLRTGEYADEYSFEGTVGQRVVIDVRTGEFDPYLILVSPGNAQEENDDWEGSTSHSRIETTLTESGTYRVLVTSYAEGETGNYEVSVEFGGAVETSGQRDVQRITAGQTTRGQLDAGDGRLERGEYRDVYVFEGQAGQPVTIDMRSTAFDTYLGLILPNGEAIQNDDFEGSTQHSQVAVTLPESGRYRIVATSYAEGETGAYEITMRAGAAAPPAPVASAPRARGSAGPQLYGVFAGISRYGGRASDLPYTADDAVRTYNAMQAGPGMPAANGVLLTDQHATAGNIRDAIERFAGQMGPDDMLVFFYSGHGGRQPRRDGFQPSDPDNLDETLEFYDRGVTDDEFAQWLDMVTDGRVLLVLDACFSGGFAKDVISRPNRMGMFSSEEDVTSSVAAKFRAGGYLAVFLADAVENKLADTDGDGAISALELSQYVHDRYRIDVKSSDGPSGGADPSNYVRTGGPQLGYQHLVVDRGSVGPYDVLFR